MGGVKIRTCSSCKSIFNDWPMRTILSEDSSLAKVSKKLALLMDWVHEGGLGGGGNSKSVKLVQKSCIFV